MIIESLALHNFGVYAGRQELELSPPDRDRPVVLIGGRNGEGKTTLLEAILVTLYGPHALPMLGRSGSYERYLRQSIHHGAASHDGAGLELQLSVLQEGAAARLRLCRTWHVRSGRVREQLTVSRDGQDDPSLADSWSDFVEGLMPRGVAPLFFFDGERIEALADLEHAAATLRTAIGSLMGLDLVDQLSSDLRAIERRHVAANADSAARQRLESLDAEVAEAERELSVQGESLASARSRADREHATLRRAQERFRLAGGELAEHRTDLEREAERAGEQVRSLEDQLRELAEGALPLALVGQALERLLHRAQAEQRVGIAEELDSILNARDSLVAGWSRELGLSEAGEISLRNRLTADRAERRPARVLDVAQLSARGVAGLDQLMEAGLPYELATLRQLLGELEAARGRAEDAESRLAAVPAPQALDELLRARGAGRAAVDQADQAVAHAAHGVEQAQRARDRATDARDKAVRELASDTLAREDSQRITRHAERTRQTLAELRRRAAGRHLARIEELISEALDELLRKERLIAEVKIDPETYELALIGRDGNLIPPRRLSAGERQLTALSLLWGLARASGRPLPVIVDTPLGRLDSSHRHLLVERYLPHASHQVIVLSTDTEVDKAATSLLNGAVGRQYRLEHDDETQATEVTEGYFFERPVVAR